ncbi:MATE family efflux transporter [Clostridium sp. MCC353]|uniref:MATE family efflux transporter n=1 Tax=Clostridium sp. MCC353 TaxID=2592646 RepID=UPI001C015AE3|nr:MATE family efflux transporter [Clostridium sp. MCC353]MBT9779658.1 MATE family efflux transporter [Clostridium sp. MCC353]
MKDREKIFSDRALLQLMIPLMMELALTLVVGLTDSIMVSSAGEAAVSGVSLVDTVMQLLIYIFAAMATGGAVVAGQYLGSKKNGEARKAATELVWINGGLSVLITAAVLLLSEWMLSALFGSITEDVYENAKAYLLITAFSIPGIGIYEAGAAIFRTMGNAKITMKVSALMNLINITGNALFIYGFSMGSRGAALGTLISRLVAAMCMAILLLNSKWELHVEKTWRHRVQWDMVKRILKVGVPGGIENGIFQLGKVVLLSFVSLFGTAAIAANAVTQTIASIQVIPGSAIQLGIVTVVSRCIGAGDYEQAAYYNRKLLKFTYIALVMLDIPIFLGLPWILRFYHLSPDTARLTTEMVFWHTLGAVTVWPLTFDLPASMRAAGDVRFAMVTSIVSMWVFRLGGAYLFAEVLGFGAVGVWMAMAMLDWGLRAVIFCIRYHSGKWKMKKVI